MVITHSKQEILKILSAIPDPEIPVISIAEIGMLKDVIVSKEGYEVLLTPTYTGCPAMGMITREIISRLKYHGIENVKVTQVLDPPWTTDNIPDEAKEKLRKYGIAPPLHSSCAKDHFRANDIACPKCNSRNTALLSRFGSTACKALYKCNDCKEPFEYFKCL